MEECSLKEKRQKLIESLRGSALEIVIAAQTCDPDVSSEDCLEIVEHAFGTAESGEDLCLAFLFWKQ